MVSIVLSRFTFSSISTVALIQYFHKFSCISSFTFISLSTVQTYSKVSQILLSYHISQSNLIQQSHILYSIYYSIFWSRLHSHLIQQFHLFKSVANSLVFSNSTDISRSTDPTYSTLSQIELYYLIPQSNLIQQSHILNSVKNSIVWSRLHSHLIQESHLFNIVSNSVVYQVSHSYLFQQFHLFKSVANLLVFSNSTDISRSTDPTFSILSQIQLYIYFTFISL